jgi:uncharacterized protein YjbI with pentapeptide repeats
MDHLDLSFARLDDLDLTGANFEASNLANANLSRSKLTGSNLAGSIVTHANFSLVNGFTKEQLYSTASYQQKNLEQIAVGFYDLSGWDLNHQNLTGASFWNSKLIGVNLAGATVTGADFGGTTMNPMTKQFHGFTKEQLYSTASYQQKNLRGINLGGGRHPFDPGNDLTGWDLSGQDLTNATLGSSMLTNVNLAGANLANAWLYNSTLTGANLTGADLRGAQDINLTAAVRNHIRRDGVVLGLELETSEELIIRDYDGDARYDPVRPPIPIQVHDQFAMSNGGVLRMILESDPWDSLIAFQSGIPVNLGGILDLRFAPDVDVRTQLGRTFRLFNWTGVAPNGAIAIRSPYSWGTSRLYTSGEVTLVAIPEPETVLLILSGLCTCGLVALLIVVSRIRFFIVCLLVCLANYSIVNARIFRWDNDQLIAGTEDIVPGPGVRLQNRQLKYAALDYADLSNAAFDQSDLTNASFFNSTLINATFDGANLTEGDFVHSTLTDANIADANLTNARFNSSVLIGANLTGAVVPGADFSSTTSRGFTKEQLYATSSYNQKNLQRISLVGNDLSGWDFSGQTLTDATFTAANLKDTDFSYANLTNAIFGGYIGARLPSASLVNTNLAGADLRGAHGPELSEAITTNLIYPDGTVHGLAIHTNESLVLHDHDGGFRYSPPVGPLAPIPVLVSQHFTIDGGVLRLEFEADLWSSLISFQPDIAVNLGGILDLGFAPGVDIRTQLGRTIRLFNWTGVTPTGAFAIRSPYVWDVSRLCTTGEVTLLAIPEPSTLVLLALAAASTRQHRRASLLRPGQN